MSTDLQGREAGEQTPSAAAKKKTRQKKPTPGHGGRPSLLFTLLHGDVDGAGVGGLQQLLVRLGRLVEKLHQQGARLLVLAPPDGGQLIQLLLHQPGVVQGVLQAVPEGSAGSA